MSRYVYSCCEADGCLLLYLESTVEEDKLDMVENQMAVGFTGNGYLAFWKRCKERERGLSAPMPLGYHRHIYRRGKGLVDETRAA